ncbi:MAG: polysaccharide deacetylase family protein [Acidobacteriota bacterium]|nr:polysaccharide deacetylase family protein [Acidobacteriota bacterium]
MKRRQFIKGAGAGAAALGLYQFAPASSAAKRPRVAVTIDDFNLFDTPTLTAAARNDAILDALSRRRLRAALFVAAKNVETPDKMRLLRRWDERGHLIGNHTYSHPAYPDTTFEEFSRDVLRAEEVLKALPRYRKLFRFPYLKEGRTPEQRDRMRAFLKARGYRNGHVTIDASDWYVDQRLRERLKKDPRAETAPYRDFYLGHIRERALFYDDLARRVLGRTVSHTLLLHHNVLNGLFLGDLLGMFDREGWELTDADDAFKDPVFKSEPNVAPAGESLIWSLAKQTGKFENLLRYPGEDGDYEKARMDALGL